MLITREQLERFFDQHCTKEEADRIAQYLEENPQVLRKYILQGWKEVDGDSPLPKEISEEMLEAIRRDIFPVRTITGKTSLIRRVIPWTAAAMILLIAGVLLGRRDNNQGPPVLARAIKSPDTVAGPLVTWQVKINNTSNDQSIALSDGSVVILYPGSTLRYREPFEVDQRALLLEGQASFKVLKDPARPFKVSAGPILTTVLGTEFNIWEGLNGVRVRLYSGKVKLKAKNSSLKGWHEDIVLLPGEQMKYMAKQDLVEVSGFEKIEAGGAARPAMAQATSDTAGIRTLIVFFDGLRPDYITLENMPNVYAFSKRGCYGKQHHSVFPTVTRVNASSYSTGSYPATHGLMGNTVYFPEVDKKKGLNTGEASELNKIAAATNGKLLTAISLGEILQKAGSRMMVFSSGSSGQALLQNHTVSGGAVINTSIILPDSLRPILEKELGPIPPGGDPNTARHKWVTDALIRYGLTLNGPLVSAIWFSDPDGTAHRDGIGAPTSMESIRSVDEQFGRIIEDLKAKHLTANFNIIISTDHGFVTHVGKEDLTAFLIKEGLKKDKESDDVIVVEGAVYVKDHDEALIRKIVVRLQSQEWIGGIFTKAVKPGDGKGFVEGTVSFDAIHWNHPQRAADILVDHNWDARKNGAGYAGASFSRGVAGHGSFSPYEVHIALLAAGPSFKKSFESELPTSNVDIVPTLLHIHHIPIPPSMDGRVISEFLVETNRQALPAVKKETILTSAKYEGGVYTLSVERTLLGKYKYVDYAKVTRVTGTVAK